MRSPAILLIHNFYRGTGGEDMVVLHETSALRRTGARVHEMYFQNPKTGPALLRLVRFLSGLSFNLRAYCKVFAYVKRAKVDVVHVHNYFYQASPAVLWAARHAGARVVVTLHNYRLFCLNALFYRDGAQCTLCADQKSFSAGVRHGCFRNSRIQSFALAASLRLHRWLGSWTSAVDRFVIINPAMRGYLEGIGVHPKKVHLKPNCIDDRPYVPMPQRDDWYLLASRLEPSKGIGQVLDAWTGLQWPLHIAGAGSMAAEVEALAAGNVSYLGLLDAEGMQQALARCKAFIFSSQLMEGMPLSIIEAMASGAICIAQSTPVTRMLIEDGVSGLLYDGASGSVALRAAVERLEQMTAAQLQMMSAEARTRFERRFSLAEHIRHMAQVYCLPLHLPEPSRQDAYQAVAV